MPVAMEFMDKPAIEICEAFAHAGYPLDVEALLIIEVEGSDAEMDDAARHDRRHRADARRQDRARIARSAMEAALIWKGRKSAFGATGRVADYICMDGTVPTEPARPCAERRPTRSSTATACASPTCSTPATATCIR